jgi:hypothetical protein
MAPLLRLLRGRPIPWALLLEAGRWATKKGREAYGRLTPSDQAELRRLLRKSKGRRSNLTERERRNLTQIVRKAFGMS